MTYSNKLFQWAFRLFPLSSLLEKILQHMETFGIDFQRLIYGAREKNRAGRMGRR